MPSTHSASIGFMGTYLILCALYLMPHPRLSHFISEERWTWRERLSCGVLSALLATSVWWSRIRLGHHTKAQVIAGGSLGSFCAVVAFILWHGSIWLQQTTHVKLKGIVPAEGLQARGKLAELAVEDLAFVALEAWEQKNAWTLIEGLRRALIAILI
jgi:dolichyldiphosphatase